MGILNIRKHLISQLGKHKKETQSVEKIYGN